MTGGFYPAAGGRTRLRRLLRQEVLPGLLAREPDEQEAVRDLIGAGQQNGSVDEIETDVAQERDDDGIQPRVPTVEMPEAREIGSQITTTWRRAFDQHVAGEATVPAERDVEMTPEAEIVCATAPGPLRELGGVIGPHDTFHRRQRPDEGPFG